MVQVAHVVARTEAEGPGLRTAIWTQGCRVRCAACCNPELFSALGGVPWSVVELLAAVPPEVEGITLLGGEPLDQAVGVTALARGAAARGLSVMLFSGYDRATVDVKAPGLLASVDVLVDGPFDLARPEGREARPRRWIGSANQGLHFLTARYRPEDFWGGNTVELRLSGGRLTVNGWPT